MDEGGEGGREGAAAAQCGALQRWAAVVSGVAEGEREEWVSVGRDTAGAVQPDRRQRATPVCPCQWLGWRCTHAGRRAAVAARRFLVRRVW